MRRAVWTVSLAAVCVLALGVSNTFAQARPPARPLTTRPWTGLVSANGGVQAGTNRLEQEGELDKYVEAAPFTAELAKAGVPWLDGGLTVRLWRNLGVGAAVSWLSTTGEAEVRAEIPHPFYFDRPRAVAGEVRVGHREVVVHASAAWLVESRRFNVLVFGGPSFFRLDQDLVADVAFDEEFPYDTATFVEADVVRVQASKAGINVGVDLTWKRSRRWNVGGLLRFSRASLPLAVDGRETGTVTIGGVMAGAGLRMIF